MKTAHIKKAFTLWKHGIADNYERFFIGIFILTIVFLIVNPDYLPDELVEGNFFISLAIYLAFPLLALYTVICIGYAAFLYLIDLLAYCVEWIRTSGKLILYNRFVWFLAAAGFLNFLVSMIVKSNAPMPVHILFHASATTLSGIVVWKVSQISIVSATSRRSRGTTILFYIVMMILGVAFFARANKYLTPRAVKTGLVKRAKINPKASSLESDVEARLVLKFIKDVDKYAETHTGDEVDKFFQNTLNKSSIGEVNRTRLKVAWKRLKQDNGDEIERIRQFQQDIQHSILETLKGNF